MASSLRGHSIYLHKRRERPRLCENYFAFAKWLKSAHER